MVSARDIVLDQLQRGQRVIESFTADFTDAEYFMPPIVGGNHAAWILGHISCTEDWSLGLATHSPKRIPESTHALFRPGSTCVPDASKYPSRKELDELFRNTRARFIEALNLSDVSTWDQPSPPEAPKTLMPTVGAIWSLAGFHQFWHFGQLTVCRQALKKKKLLQL